MCVTLCARVCCVCEQGWIIHRKLGCIVYNTYCIILCIVLCIVFTYNFKIIQPKSSCIIHNTQYNTYCVLIRIMYCLSLRRTAPFTGCPSLEPSCSVHSLVTAKPPRSGRGPVQGSCLRSMEGHWGALLVKQWPSTVNARLRAVVSTVYVVDSRRP